MAIYTPAAEFEHFTGALSKKKNQERLCVTRIKPVKDPITGEVVGYGPKEIYAQERRDYKEHPLTPKETAQRTRWREACREASLILHDKSHPRYMELYHRWRAQLTPNSSNPSNTPNTSNTPCKQFPNFVRSVLATEKRPE